MLRLYEVASDQRFDLAATPAGKTEVRRSTREHFRHRKPRLPDDVVDQLGDQFHDGLLLQLRSVPVGLRIDARIHRTYPVLRDQQRTAAIRQLNEGAAALRPEVLEIAPPRVCAANIAMSAALAALERGAEADALYVRASELGSTTAAGEVAKEARSRLAQATFRKKSGGALRMDAVMHCLGALERFDAMPPQEVQRIGFEIALLGRHGLDTADPSCKYTLASLPGEFSGLHLVCLMYVAFKRLAPEQDVGLDLASEYAAAQSLLRKGRP